MPIYNIVHIAHQEHYKNKLQFNKNKLQGYFIVGVNLDEK